MKPEFDRIPSTITLSMGLKNKIRKLKGNRTYEEFLSSLIRMRNNVAHGNTFEFVEFERRNLTYFDWGFSILFDYNTLNNSQNHVFDIRIKRIVHKGSDVDFAKMVEEIVLKNAFSSDGTLDNYKEILLYFSYEKIYTRLLHLVIHKETGANFSHRGRFTDFELWKKEFENLGLSQKAYENDIYEKILDYQSGVPYK